MKKIQLIINIALGVAVIALFVLYFSGKKNNSIQDIIDVTTTISADSASIAYIKYDSLLLHYELYHDLSQKLELRKQELESEFASRQKGYEKLFKDYNEKVSKGLVTRYQAQEMEENLAKEQQNLLNIRDQLTAQLMEEEQVFNRQLYYKITEFLKEYNKNKGYQYIFNHQFGGPLLYTEESFDITKEAIEGLNKEYLKNKE